MKLLFRAMLMLLILKAAQARHTFVITHDQKSSLTMGVIKNYFNENGVSELWLYVESESPCAEKFNESVLHLCVEENDIHVKTSKKDILSKSFSQLVK